ncbi:hypothetical protein Anas_08171, partial [Armadillidium nasatum]
MDDLPMTKKLATLPPVPRIRTKGLEGNRRLGSYIKYETICHKRYTVITSHGVLKASYKPSNVYEKENKMM